MTNKLGDDEIPSGPPADFHRDHAAHRLATLEQMVSVQADLIRELETICTAQDAALKLRQDALEPALDAAQIRADALREAAKAAGDAAVEALLQHEPDANALKRQLRRQAFSKPIRALIDQPAPDVGALIAAEREACAVAATLAGPHADLADHELSDIGKTRREMANRCAAAIRARGET